MAIGAEQAAIRTVIASALVEHVGESGRGIDALFAIGQAEAIVKALERAGYEIKRGNWVAAVARSRSNEPIEPMTLGDMRENGVRSLDVSCWQCHHRAILSADPWPDDVAVPTFGPRMVCTAWALTGAMVVNTSKPGPDRRTGLRNAEGKSVVRGEGMPTRWVIYPSGKVTLSPPCYTSLKSTH
jgi:hypothetical protein